MIKFRIAFYKELIQTGFHEVPKKLVINFTEFQKKSTYYSLCLL